MVSVHNTCTSSQAVSRNEFVEHNGVYLQDCQIAPDDEVKPFATDKKSAERLWKLSEELVGQTFDF